MHGDYNHHRLSTAALSPSTPPPPPYKVRQLITWNPILIILVGFFNDLHSHRPLTSSIHESVNLLTFHAWEISGGHKEMSPILADQ
jgi:hypothetical protein